MTLLAILVLVAAQESPRVLNACDQALVISSQGSKQVVVAEPLKYQLVFLDPKGSSENAQVAALATALNASAIELGNITSIVQTSNDLRRIRGAHSSTRAKWISNTLESIGAYRTKALAGRSVSESFVQDVERVANAQEEFRAGRLSADRLGNFGSIYLLPSEAFAERLLKRIGIDKIASQPTGSVSIWEDFPVAGTDPLPSHEDLDSGYFLERSRVKMPEFSVQFAGIVAALGYGDELNSESSDSRLAKTRVRVAHTTNAVIISVEAFDDKGQRVLRVNFTSSPTGVVLSDKAILSRFVNRDVSDDAPLRQESAAAAAYERTGNAKLPQWLLQPDRYEPLDLFVRDAIVGLQRREPSKKCFAACVSDGLWRTALPCIDGTRINVAALKAELEAWLPYERVETASAVVFRPEDSEGDLMQRSSRKALAQFAKSMLRSPDFRNVAALFHNSGPVQRSLDSTWIRLVQSPREVPLGIDASRQFFWLLGALSDDAWSSLVLRGSDTIGRLGIESSVSTYVRTDSSIQLVSRFPLPDVFKFAPENIPNGVTGECLIEVLSKPQRLVKIFTSGKQIPDGWDAFRGFGALLCPAELVRKKEDGSLFFTLSRTEAEKRLENIQILLASRTSYEVRIHLTPDKIISQIVHGTIAPEEAAIRYMDLTAAQKDEAWESGRRAAFDYVQSLRETDMSEFKRKKGVQGTTIHPN